VLITEAYARKAGLRQKPRPERLKGVTYRRETPLGTAFITVNELAEDGEPEPFEVFINVGKAGSDIASVSEAIGRLISLCLRMPSPMPPKERVREIVDQLWGIGGGRQLGFGKRRVRSLPRRYSTSARRTHRHLRGTPQCISSRCSEGKGTTRRVGRAGT